MEFIHPAFAYTAVAHTHGYTHIYIYSASTVYTCILKHLLTWYSLRRAHVLWIAASLHASFTAAASCPSTAEVSCASRSSSHASFACQFRAGATAQRRQQRRRRRQWRRHQRRRRRAVAAAAAMAVKLALMHIKACAS
jgi:acyl-CoA thioesterase FadM